MSGQSVDRLMDVVLQMRINLSHITETLHQQTCEIRQQLDGCLTSGSERSTAASGASIKNLLNARLRSLSTGGFLQILPLCARSSCSLAPILAVCPLPCRVKLRQMLLRGGCAN